MHDPATYLVAGIALITIAIMFVLRRILRSPSRQVERLLQQLEAGKVSHPPKRPEFDHEIKLTETGFSIHPVSSSADAACHGEWLSVRTVTAFKADLLTTDCVCLAFELSDGSVIQAHEEMHGWLDLCKALPLHLRGAPPWEKWFMAITVTAFEPCTTFLYRADTVASST